MSIRDFCSADDGLPATADRSPGPGQPAGETKERPQPDRAAAFLCTKPRCGQPNSVRPRLTPLITAMCLKGVPKILSIRYIPLEGV
ncbi:hypothetical protein, partial [Faecalibaculum rodentium]|uniref:hypothetical protein n=1 Tax=Faecalibaculum rodentium TaxID=1702221 RepID=UPI001C4C4A65